MKRSLPLFFLLLLFSAQLLHAFPHDLGQLYDGPAQPRAEVAWIWLDWQVKVAWIDNHQIRRSAQLGLLTTRALEVLPGKHTISVSFDNGSVRSESAIGLEIDAKAGENYLIQSAEKAAWNLKSHGTWNATIDPYTPSEKDVSKLNRVLMERTVGVEGVVQSCEMKKRASMYTVQLATPSDPQRREFTWYFSVKEGQKVRVNYYPSSPGEAAYVQSID
jgi:hypothetical protein